MKDFIPNGTGNSRYMKSSVPSGTTWEQALAMLRAGTFPFDLNGVNASGVAQMGTPLNKASLLQDSTASALGLSGDPTVDDAFSKIDSLIGSLDSEVSGLANTAIKIETGSYTGTGTTGSSSSPITITFSSPFLLVIMLNWEYDSKFTSTLEQETEGGFGGEYRQFNMVCADLLTTSFQAGVGWGYNGDINLGSGDYRDYSTSLKKSSNGRTLYWYESSDYAIRDPLHVFNDNNSVYHWIAITEA